MNNALMAGVGDPEPTPLAKVVAESLADAGSLREAGPRLLRAICAAMRWDMAALWTFEPRGEMRRVEIWSGGRFGPELLATPGQRAIGDRLASLSGPLWLEDLDDAGEDVPGAAELARAGVTSGCWIPLHAEGGMEGLLELVSRDRRPPDHGLLQAVDALHGQLGQFLKRIGAETIHPADRRCHRLLADGIVDYAIFLLDREGRVATWNTGGERVTGLVAADVVGKHVSCLHLDEDVRARRPLAELHAAALKGRFEADGWRRRRDGSRFWANAVVTAIRDASGALLGFAVVERDDTERRRQEDELAAEQGRLRALAAHVDAAAEREKARLAREIHDVLGQTLTGLKMDVAWIGRRLAGAAPDQPGAALRERLGTMSAQLDDCIQSIRRIATGLRPTILDDLGLAAAIEWQAREFGSRSGLAVEVSLPAGDVAVERERAVALFRTLQELLTNVARHAAAHQVRVRLRRSDRGLVLEVTDDGRGIGEAERSRPGSLGFLGIRERVAVFGGTLELRGAPGCGTTAVVRVPMPVRHE